MDISAVIIPIVFFAILTFFLIIAIFQWLWNITIPQVFNLREISFWVAFRLLLIASILSSGSFINFNWNN